MKIFTFSLKIFSFILLLFIWEYSLISYRDLPEIIPIHFGLDGVADGFGSKKFIWLLAIIPTLIFVWLLYLSKKNSSSLINLPSNIKEDKRLTSLILMILNVDCMLIFSALTYESIQIALRLQEKLSSVTNYFLLLLFLQVAAIIGYSFYLKKLESKTPIV
jgi:uncharacterized membrane protein